MTQRAASSPAGLRGGRGLMLAVPTALIALVVARFAVAPTGNSHRANDPLDGRLLPTASRDCVAAPAIDAPVAVPGAAVPGGERAGSWPSRAARRLEW